MPDASEQLKFRDKQMLPEFGGGAERYGAVAVSP
jgi:hypothetical protein